MTARSTHIDPDTKITELVKRLTDDSKRLVHDEVQLAKLEIKENVKMGARGALWLTVAFGFAIVALVALTVGLTALIGKMAGGHIWVGAVATGLIEVVIGALLIKGGAQRFGEPSYTLGESREEIRNTVAWVGRERSSSSR